MGSPKIMVIAIVSQNRLITIKTHENFSKLKKKCSIALGGFPRRLSFRSQIGKPDIIGNLHNITMSGLNYETYHLIFHV